MSSASIDPAAAPARGVAAADVPPVPGGNLFLRVFPSIMLPMFLAALDQTIVATALPAIVGELGDVERISWIVVSYLVASTIAAPVYGRLGDVLGRKRMMFLALSVFIAASVLCAAAASVIMLALARILQGLGGGGLMTLSQALIGESVPPRQRGKYQGYLSATFVCASTFGPVAGGYLTQHFGWQSVFLVNLPLGLVAVGLAMRLPRMHVGGGRLQFDIWGTLFFAAFVVPLLLALEQAQRFDLAVLPAMAALLAAAAGALVLLLRQERRAPAPLLPLALFRQAAIWRTDLMAACLAGATISLITFVPVYLQVVRGTSPSETGLLLLPLTAGIGVGSLFTGRMIAATGRTTIFPEIGLSFSLGLSIAFALLAPRLSLGVLPWLLGVTALSFGTGMPVVQMTVQTIAGPKFLGAAAASVQFSRSIGAALGTAMVATVLFAVLSRTDRDTAAHFADIMQRGAQVLVQLPQERRAIVQAQIADAFRAAFLMIAGFAGCGLALSWAIPLKRL